MVTGEALREAVARAIQNAPKSKQADAAIRAIVQAARVDAEDLRASGARLEEAAYSNGDLYITRLLRALAEAAEPEGGG